MAKKTNAEIARQISQIQKWLASGLRSVDIEKKCIELGYCESIRHCRRLIKMATAKWVADDDISILEQRLRKEKELIALKRTLQKKYKGTPSGIMAIARIENQIIKLKGLAAPVKIELAGKDGGPIQTESKGEIDMTKLSNQVLLELLAARVKKAQ